MKNDSTAELGASSTKLGNDLMQAASDAGQGVKEFGNVQVHAAQDAVAHVQDAVQRRARQYAGNADDYVRRYPWETIAAAAVAGAVLALLFARA